MKKFYENIESFLNSSTLENGAERESMRGRAIAIHRSIDILVRKMQLLKEYADLLEDEFLFFSELYERIGFSVSTDFFNSIQTRLLELENSFYSNGSHIKNYEKSILEMKKELEEHVDKMYRLGERLRSSDLLKNLGG